MQRKASLKILKIKLIAITVACTIFGCSRQKQERQQQAKPTPTQTHTHTHTQTQTLEPRLQQAGLVDIQTIDNRVLVDLKYSTTDNFVGVDVYGDLDRCYLQPAVAEMLATAQDELNRRHPGYRLLIYDCVRPLSVQQILWDTLQKPDDVKHLYVADPRQGSIHNYGSAVDLTIVDQQGQSLDMGTGYDFFGELAYPSKEEELLASGALTGQQATNRTLLREVMGSAGLTPISTEWWHFNAYSRERAAELFDIVE